MRKRVKCILRSLPLPQERESAKEIRTQNAAVVVGDEERRARRHVLTTLRVETEVISLKPGERREHVLDELRIAAGERVAVERVNHEVSRRAEPR